MDPQNLPLGRQEFTFTIDAITAIELLATVNGNMDPDLPGACLFILSLRGKLLRLYPGLKDILTEEGLTDMEKVETAKMMLGCERE